MTVTTIQEKDQLQRLKEKLSPDDFNTIITYIYSPLPDPDLTKGEEPTYEQKQWVERRMRGPARSWERWYVGQYFTQQQKKELGLTDKDITKRNETL